MFSDYRILFLFLIPVVLTGIFLSRYKSNYGWRDEGESRDFNIIEAIISFVLFVSVIAIGWPMGRNARINSYNEQIGGFITEKFAVDGSHEESHESCSGSGDDRHCTTYYTTEYHREFWVKNNTGDWWDGNTWYERVDKPCESCEPYRIPQYYLDAYIGKPVSLDHSYSNYLAAVGDDIYRNTYQGLVESMPDICWSTPDVRLSYDTVMRVFTMGFPQGSSVIEQVRSWNFSPTRGGYDITNPNAVPMYADTQFGLLGTTVQGDPHIYVMNSTNPQYAEMCLAKWRGGAKNSISVFIFGSYDGTSYHPTDVYVAVGVDGAKKNGALQFKNENERNNYYLKFDIRKQLLDYFQNGGGLDRERVLGIVTTNVYSKFVRQEMAEFKALKSQVKPTNLFILGMAIFLAIADTILHFVFANNDI